MYEADPSPAVLGHDLRDALRLSLHAALWGALPRADQGTCRKRTLGLSSP
ncbi:hypothetical protein OG233_17425 [Streptomyces sp. NBC_01218]|nr:hypothetical protein OG233_17425 [Streptomyces sp. NBC_01218]